MANFSDVGRWPPVYDEQELADSIAEMTSSVDFATEFFTQALRGEPDFCQGDIVQLSGSKWWGFGRGPSSAPLLDENGNGALDDPPVRWLVLGNTCDFVRVPEDARWTQLIPLECEGDQRDAPPGTVAGLRKYQTVRRFYVPPLSPDDQEIRFANFLRPVTVHKEGLRNHGAMIARMSRKAWYLFHACVVRFLARSDGRLD